MPFTSEIQQALIKYDQAKGLGRQIIGDAPSIAALRSLPDADQTNLFKCYQCFANNLPKPDQASYQVYLAVLKVANLKEADAGLVLDLYQSGCLATGRFEWISACELTDSNIRHIKALRAQGCLTDESFKQGLKFSELRRIAVNIQLIKAEYPDATNDLEWLEASFAEARELEEQLGIVYGQQLDSIGCSVPSQSGGHATATYPASSSSYIMRFFATAPTPASASKPPATQTRPRVSLAQRTEELTQAARAFRNNAKELSKEEGSHATTTNVNISVKASFGV